MTETVGLRPEKEISEVGRAGQSRLEKAWPKADRWMFNLQWWSRLSR